jgi:thioredoxin-dependent peroxiredoxin
MKVGQPAPNFTAQNRAGENISLHDFNGRWLILYFYPKDNTPGCTTQATDFTSKLADFRLLNTEIVGISPDSIVSHEKFITKHKLGITLLSDPEHQIADLYEVWQLKKFMGKEYMGIVRSTFLIDPTGNIAHIWPNVKVKNHAETVFDRLKQISV